MCRYPSSLWVFDPCPAGDNHSLNYLVPTLVKITDQWMMPQLLHSSWKLGVPYQNSLPMNGTRDIMNNNCYAYVLILVLLETIIHLITWCLR
jgi:hypothetical protein